MWALWFRTLLNIGKGLPHGVVHNNCNGVLWSLFGLEYLSPIYRTVRKGLDDLTHSGQGKKKDGNQWMWKSAIFSFHSILNPEAILIGEQETPKGNIASDRSFPSTAQSKKVCQFVFLCSQAFPLLHFTLLLPSYAKAMPSWQTAPRILLLDVIVLYQ